MDISLVLKSLMSKDNEIRRQVEEYYNQLIQNDVNNLLDSLMNVFINQNIDIVLRSFAGVLLRKIIESHSEKLSLETIQVFRNKLISLWSIETNTNMLQRLSHVMAQSALKNEWKELIPSIIQYSSNLQLKSMISVLGLIEIISDYCPEDIVTNLQTLGPFLSQFIASPDVMVQISCAKAIGACIISIEDDVARNSFKPALEPILNVLGLALSRNEEIDATKIMNYLVTIAQEQPNFFKGSLDAIVNAMLTVANAKGLEFSTRAMALELMVTITETSPSQARRCNSLIHGLIPLAMSLMLEIEEDEHEWISGIYTEEPSDENCFVGDEAIERVSAGLGGKHIADIVLGLVQQYSCISDYKYRRAAVAGLCRLAEGSTKYFKKYFEQSLSFLTNAMNDQSARVQYEGIQSVGRLSALYPDCNTQLIDTFLPRLTILLQNHTTCDRVRGHSASALINLFNPDTCELDTIQKYLDPLLHSIAFSLQSAPMEVRSPCLTLLGCIAQVCGSAFIPYYNVFMPGIKSILSEATSSDLIVLRGKAMECTGLIGEAVGVQIFGMDALEIMQLFMHTLQLDKERDITFEYILPACARISRALRDHFEPFLPSLMTPLLEGAKQEIQFSMVDADEDDVEGEVVNDEDNGIQSAIISIGGAGKKRVTLNTHSIQQKNQAARVIYEFADALKGYLKSYILPIMQVLVGLVVNKHSSELRASSSLALSKMFEAMLHAMKLGYLYDNPSQNISLDAVLVGSLSKLLDALREETDASARYCAAEALRDILSSCYQSGSENEEGIRQQFLLIPSRTISEKIVKEILTRCGESLERRKNKAEQIEQNDGYDAEDREASYTELEEEEDLLTIYADIFGQLLKLHGEAFIPEFDHFIAPAFSQYLNNKQPEALQKVAIYLVDDLVEFGGKSATKYIPTLLPTFLSNTNSSVSILIRQASIYGLGKAVFTAPELISNQLGSILPCLMSVINDEQHKCFNKDGVDNDEDNEEVDNEGCVENAIFAIGTISCEPAYRNALQELPNGSIQQLSKVWLQHMPLKLDQLSAKIASKQLCDCIERNDCVILGENFTNMKEIFRIIAEIFQTFKNSTIQNSKMFNSPNTIAFIEESDGFGTNNEDTIVNAHPTTIKRFQAIMRQFTSIAANTATSNPNQNAAIEIQKAFVSLNPEMQQAIKDII